MINQFLLQNLSLSVFTSFFIKLTPWLLNFLCPVIIQVLLNHPENCLLRFSAWCIFSGCIKEKDIRIVINENENLQIFLILSFYSYKNNWKILTWIPLPNVDWNFWVYKYNYRQNKIKWELKRIILQFMQHALHFYIAFIIRKLKKRNLYFKVLSKIFERIIFSKL